MQGGKFFRYRFFIIGAVFWFGFSLYSVDRRNAGAALGRWLARHLDVNKAHALREVFCLAAVLCIVAALIRTWASAYLNSNVVHDTNLHSERLVADGPYRYVRNPLYLGLILLGVGMGALASRLGFFVIVSGLIAVAYRLISQEEAQLRASQGEIFQRYLEAVPRLWPSFRPRVPASGARPRWAQAFFGETFFWAFAVGVVAYAATLSLKAWYIALIAAMLLYAISFFWFKRGKSVPPAA